MGLIGIKIRIATKEKLIPEFQFKESSKTETEEIAKTETEEIAKTETEEIAKTETEEIAKTETEQIKIEEEKMKTLVTLEEEEEKLK
jgi:small subunit ribosomal protein S3